MLLLLAIELICSTSLHGMQKQPKQEFPLQNITFTIPAIANKVYKQVTKTDLLNIKPESQLGPIGIITALIVRPEKDKRTILPSLQLMPQGYIYGDKQQEKKDDPDRQYGAVSLMRSDVSHALGGSFIPGDNIHVEGLHIGKDHLADGDLIIISDPETLNIKSILLKTYVAHYACWKLLARCGQDAFNFLNAEGEYENGNNKEKEEFVHGLHHRLRGIMLVILKGGEIALNDLVTIAHGTEKDTLLAQLNLTSAAAQWLEKSVKPAEEYENQEKAKRELRNKTRVKK